MNDDPHLARELSQECLDLLEQGAVPPLPITCFPYRDYAEALRLMTTGKLVLPKPQPADVDDRLPVADLRRLAPPVPPGRHRDRHRGRRRRRGGGRAALHRRAAAPAEGRVPLGRHPGRLPAGRPYGRIAGHGVRAQGARRPQPARVAHEPGRRRAAGQRRFRHHQPRLRHARDGRPRPHDHRPVLTPAVDGRLARLPAHRTDAQQPGRVRRRHRRPAHPGRGGGADRRQGGRAVRPRRGSPENPCPASASPPSRSPSWARSSGCSSTIRSAPWS